MDGVTPYNTTVFYSCDIARQLLNTSISTGYGVNFTEALYDFYPLKCEWNKTWSPEKEVRYFALLKCLLCTIFS